MDSDVKELLIVPNKQIALEVQHLLEESGIYCLLESITSSSLMALYFPSTVIECITVKVHRDDYSHAVEIVCNNGYEEYFSGNYSRDGF